MFRAFLTAIGISMCIIGGECLVVDQAVVAYPNRTKGKANKSARGAHFPFGQQTKGPTVPDSRMTRHKIKPPEWAPWSFLSGGVVLALYGLTVQRE